jgi:hypothetical protein
MGATSRYGCAMRALVIAGAAALVLAAALVPLPLRVEQPDVLVAVVGEVVVRPVGDAPPAAGGTGPGIGSVRGSFLGPAVRDDVTAVGALVALASPGSRLRRGAGAATGPIDRALHIAAGVAPGRATDGLPVEVEVSDEPPVGRRALALALHVADAAGPFDLAGGRAVVALADVADDGALRCPGGLDRSIGVAGSPSIDAVIAAAGCGAGDGVLEAATLEEAIALLLRDGADGGAS